MPKNPHPPRRGGSKKPAPPSLPPGEDTSFIVFSNSKGEPKKSKKTDSNAKPDANDKGKAKAKGAPEQPEDAPKKPDARTVIGGASWTGKLPVNMLSEHCQKQKWDKPEYTMNKVKGGFVSHVILKATNPKTRESTTLPPIRLPIENQDLAVQPTALEARHFAATYTLYRVANMKNIHMMMPPNYRDLWKGPFADMKKEDVKSGKGWMYEADPFVAYKEREQAKAEADKKREETAKQREKAKSQPAGVGGPSSGGSNIMRGWTRVPKLDMGKRVRTEIERLIRRDAVWNPHSVKISSAQRSALVDEIVKLGFRKSHVEEAAETCKDREEILEWLLIHVPEDDLPPWSLPEGYTAGISMASGNLKREAAIKRLAATGYAVELCEDALDSFNGDEAKAASLLQARLLGDDELADQLSSTTIADAVEQQRMLRAREKLPAWALQEEIVDAVDQHQVVIISGETGSGKSTQSVQFILDDMIQHKLGEAVNIVLGMIEIQGRTHPVTDYYVDDVIRMAGFNGHSVDEDWEDEESQKNIGGTLRSMGMRINYDLIAQTVQYIDAELGSQDGAILIFLPGTMEIDRTLQLAETWASRAACKQRRGRAGRVRAGICYKLYTRNVEREKMMERPDPEIRRVPLEQLCLSVKAMGVKDVASFLGGALTPPDSVAVEGALELLGRMGAIDGDEMTALGRHLAVVPADLRCAKLMVYGATFGCLESCLTMASILTVRSPFVSPQAKREESKAARSSFGKGQGDLIADLRAYEHWTGLKEKGIAPRDLRAWCEQNFLSTQTLNDITSNRRQYLSSLQETGFIPLRYSSYSASAAHEAASLNRHNTNDALLRALVAGSFNPQIARIDFPDKKFAASVSGAVELDPEARTIKYFNQDNGRVFVHPSSTLFDAQGFPSGAAFMSYFTKMATSKVFIRDLTPFNSYSLLLFSGPITLDTMGRGIVVEGWLRLRGWARIGVLVSRLRMMLDEALARKIDDPSMDLAGSDVVGVVRKLVELDGLDR
ncbi:dead deah box helicase [Neofusicoccum parvum]|nr:dead deah box helicase [Neofusicoccum parvum]